MTDFVGRVDSVFTRNFTAAVETTAVAGSSVLTVTDGGDLDEIGQLLTPWDGTVYNYEYDGDATVTLAAPLTSDAAQGETLIVWDPAKAAPVVETVAHVVPLGDGVTEDVVEARVSYPLIPLLGEGIRDDETAEAVTVREDADSYVVAEVLGQAASMTDEFVNDVLVPQLPPVELPGPDGLEPAANPDVTLRPGIGALFVVWEPVDNADPVTYDVYAVPAADVARLTFPPLDTDKVGEVLEGTAAQIRALPDGTDLSPEGSYAIAVYARDADGTCPTDAVPVIGAPAKVNSEDLAVNAITVDHLTGNDALFQALQAEDITGVTITGSTIQTADTGLYWRLSSGTESMKIEAVKAFTDGPAFQNAHLGNLGLEDANQRGVGTAMSAGALQPWSGYRAGGVTTSVTQSRASSADPWSPQRYSSQVIGHDVRVEATYPHTGDTTPSSITLDAKGNEAAVGIHGDHIDISTYAYGGDSVNVATGELTLSGDVSVEVNAPNGFKVNGVPFTPAADSGWQPISLLSGFGVSGSETPSYRKIGNVVYLRGRVAVNVPTIGTGNTAFGNIPDGFRPAISNEIWPTVAGGPSASFAPARFFVTSAGVLNINALSGSFGAGYSFPISTSFLID